MRHLLMAVVAMMLLVASPSFAARELPSPKLIAVYFHADYCPNCKILGPTLAAARKEGALDTKPVLFVTLDLTRPESIHQSILNASALGIAPYVQKQGSGTGYVALLSADGKTELARFERTATTNDIITAITSQLSDR
jgi:thiol-disulfide isomerase/thioredoxin